jgi:tartronate-semialdehyde synthase
LDDCVQLAFDYQNVADAALEGCGVDHQAVVEGLGCKALRLTDPGKIGAALAQARTQARTQTRTQTLARAHRVPVVVEVILEKVTNIATAPRSMPSTGSRTSSACTPRGTKAWWPPGCWSE